MKDGNVEYFTHHFKTDEQSMQIVLNQGFTNDNFEALVQFYQERVSKGITNWDVDLANLEFVNSVALGVLVAFNAAVGSRGGRLRLILKRDSKVTELLRLTKLDRIISCIIM